MQPLSFVFLEDNAKDPCAIANVSVAKNFDGKSEKTWRFIEFALEKQTEMWVVSTVAHTSCNMPPLPFARLRNPESA